LPAGEFSPTGTKHCSNKSSIKMIDNFVAPSFSQIEVKKITLIDDIEYPGITSTVKGCVEHAGLNVYNGKAMTSGFKSHDYEVKQFEATGKLADLGLGFFNDINIPIYKGYFQIIFTRNSNNNVIHRRKGLKDDGTEDPSSLPPEGKVTINDFYLRVPIIEYSIEAKINLVNDLVSNSYFFEYKKWWCIQYPRVTGNSLNINITQACKSVSNPVWAFVVFQANRSNSQLKDNGNFDHTNVRNLWTEIAEKRYPE
jgi:hypothetical protein